MLTDNSRRIRFAAGLATFGLAILPLRAQQTATQPGTKALTVERIFSEPDLSGRKLRGIAWKPDGTQVSFLDTQITPPETTPPTVENKHEPKNKTKKELNADLWVVDAAGGERRVLVAADKLASMLPENTAAPTQATGLGRHAPADYQWSPDGNALLFQGPSALVWFDLKSQKSRTLVSGKVGLADPKISPDGKFVSFVRDHNLWLVNIVDGKEHALTRGGVEELRKGELDWVYPEELDLSTAYWWSPDSKSVAYLQFDTSREPVYPHEDTLRVRALYEPERYPQAGENNPDVHLGVVSAAGGATRWLDVGDTRDSFLQNVRDTIRLKHLSIRTEEAYLARIKQCIIQNFSV